ncbi:hypothetical protein Tco_1380281, partial [Tanacetum coccineum]
MLFCPPVSFPFAEVRSVGQFLYDVDEGLMFTIIILAKLGKYESTFIPQAADYVSRKCIRQISFLYLVQADLTLLRNAQRRLSTSSVENKVGEPNLCTSSIYQGGREVSQKIQEFHFPSCSSIGNQDKQGTTVRRENTRSYSDLDMWNRLAPYVLRLFGRHGPSP